MVNKRSSLAVRGSGRNLISCLAQEQDAKKTLNQSHPHRETTAVIESLHLSFIHRVTKTFHFHKQPGISFRESYSNEKSYTCRKLSSERETVSTIELIQK